MNRHNNSITTSKNHPLKDSVDVLFMRNRMPKEILVASPEPVSLTIRFFHQKYYKYEELAG